MINKMKKIYAALAIALCFIFVGCGEQPSTTNNDNKVVLGSNSSEENSENTNTEKEDTKEHEHDDDCTDCEDDKIEDEKDNVSQNKDEVSSNDKDIFEGYKLIEVDGGNKSGHREPNVVVDIGFGDREYYAFTNEYGQLVKVIAKEIILQDDKTEPVTSKGRYYSDEAKVPGVEHKNLDEGHVIADSLGGVSNAYNITPQESTLNRHGDQAYMEKNIREAGGCTDFTAIITYPNTTTQIPSHYSYTYTLKGNVINDEFDNVNPDDYNSKLEEDKTTDNNTTTDKKEPQINENSKTVYWTPNGKSYHTTKDCSTLSRSKVILEGTIKESGKTDPCDRCH